MPDTSGEKSCGIFQSKGGEFARTRLLWTIGQFVFFFHVIVVIDLRRANYLSLPQSSLTVIKTVWVNLRWRVEVKDKDELKNWIKAPVKMCFLISFRFSVKGWSHTSGNASVPVLIEARPQSAMNLSGGLIHSYSFIDFFFDEPEFQAQREIWCRGAIRPPPLPKLPSRFDVNLERVTSESTRVWSVQVVTRVIISKEKDNRLSLRKDSRLSLRMWFATLDCILLVFLRWR